MMRQIAFLAPLTAALALAGAAAAQPSAVVVTVSPDFAKTAEELGQRDVQQQVDDLTRKVERVLTGALGHDLDALSVDERRAQIAYLPLLLDRERGLRQAGSDRERRVMAGRAGLEVEGVAVGKGDLHGPKRTGASR